VGCTNTILLQIGRFEPATEFVHPTGRNPVRPSLELEKAVERMRKRNLTTLPVTARMACWSACSASRTPKGRW
jgi:hypothetical protein